MCTTLVVGVLSRVEGAAIIRDRMATHAVADTPKGEKGTSRTEGKRVPPRYKSLGGRQAEEKKLSTGLLPAARWRRPKTCLQRRTNRVLTRGPETYPSSPSIPRGQQLVEGDSRSLTGQGIEKASSLRRSAAAAWELAFPPIHRQCPEFRCIRTAKSPGQDKPNTSAEQVAAAVSRLPMTLGTLNSISHSAENALMHPAFWQAAERILAWVVELRFGDTISSRSRVCTNMVVCFRPLDLVFGAKQGHRVHDS